MRVMRLISLIVLTVLLAAPQAEGAACRKKKAAAAPAGPQKISLKLDLAQLRDSIRAQETIYWDEIITELADSDRVALEALIARLGELSRFRPVFGAASGSYLGDLAVSIAYEHLGKPYVWGANGPDSFDCSGFVRYVFKQVGYPLPRTSREQFLEGEEVRSTPELRKGDLVFFSGRRGSVGHNIGHVGIVADVDFDRGFYYFIHANSSNKGVSVSRSDEKYFLLHFKGARRIIPLD